MRNENHGHALRDERERGHNSDPQPRAREASIDWYRREYSLGATALLAIADGLLSLGLAVAAAFAGAAGAVVGAVVLVALASACSGDEPMGPPDPPSREEVIAASFPGFTPAESIERRMRTSKRVGWSLFACDAVTTLATPNTREIHPWAFGNKYFGVALSGLATWGAIRLEERALRQHRPERANFIRYFRGAVLVATCGWNLSLSF